MPAFLIIREHPDKAIIRIEKITSSIVEVVVSQKEAADDVERGALKRAAKELDSTLCGVWSLEQRLASRVVEFKVATETREKT